jgi:myo-inositol catabolism protein IolC
MIEYERMLQGQENDAQVETTGRGSHREAPLFMLAFDHRRSILGLFGVRGAPTPSDQRRIGDAKRIIFAGLMRAGYGLELVGAPGLLVDEQFGGHVLDLARDRPVVAAVACERSGQAEFQFEYGDDFGTHIERFDPELVKALVRFNPDGDGELNRRQIERLRMLSDWLAARDRKLLFELLVPPEEHQLRTVGNDRRRYDAELRPELVCRAVAELQEEGVEPAIWKLEGIEERSDCERIAETCRRHGRDDVSCLILGRGADQSKVEHWLRAAAPVEGFGGFAVGRTIWWDAIASHLAGELDRAHAIATIAERYLLFVDIYRAAGSAPGQ